MRIKKSDFWQKSDFYHKTYFKRVLPFQRVASVGWVANWDGENCEFSDSHAGALIVIHKYLSS